MSRDTARTPSPTPNDHARSMGGAGGVLGQQGASGSSYFLKERERLVNDIADSLGQIFNHSNALNRKLEEEILVGKEFEPVAALWGRFVDLMGSAGVADPTLAQEEQSSGPQGDETEAAAGDVNAAADDARRSRGPGASVNAQTQGEAGMPPGVAPGGGTWTAVHANQ